MEKFYDFLPSLLTITCIAVAVFLCVKLAAKRFGANLKSVEWNKNNFIKVALTIDLPLILILAPTAEELIFRAPLVIAFGSMSSAAWCGVVVSSILFALGHWPKKVWLVPDLSSKKEIAECESDDIITEVNRLQKKDPKKVIAMKISNVIFTLIFGLLSGYLGITYQSIWLCVGLHAAWNLIVPTILPIILQILAILVILALGGINFLYDKAQRKIRMRRREKALRRYMVTPYSDPR